MNHLARLANELMLGVERRTPELPDLPAPFEAFAEAVNAPDLPPETRLLRRSGVLTVCASAGYVPPRASAPLPPPCADEALRHVDDERVAAALRRVVENGPDPLRVEAMRLLAGGGYALPPRLLPGALALGQKSADFRAALLPVLGKRGDWLARQMPAWAWAVGATAPEADASVWVHGTPDQRKQYLAALRECDPAAARRLLEDGFGQLDARERAALLALLQVHLSVNDEDFVEARLQDRSKEVRQQAARMLSGLPASRFVARMTERMQCCMRRERKLLRTVLTLEAPVQFGADWKNDALEETRAKSESLGERAWWLYQIARALPLAWWTQYAGMMPAELIKWAGSTDWSEAMLRAWSEALQRDGDASWAEAFLAAPAIKGLPLDAFALIDCLPWERRESHWLGMLASRRRDLALGDLLLRAMDSPRDGAQLFSAGFVQNVLGEARKILPHDTGRFDYNLRQALPRFICLIPRSCLDEAAGNWPMGRPESAYFNEAMAAMLAIIEQRKILHSTLSPR